MEFRMSALRAMRTSLLRNRKTKAIIKIKLFFPAIYYKSKKAIQVLFLIWF